jgi:cytochrome c oxidase subunit 2
MPRGLAVLEAKGCLECHSVDGKPMVGPTLKGIYGKEQQVILTGVAKTITVDEAFLRRVITNPTDVEVRGYPPAMPETLLTEPELIEIIRYIKSLN